jgi:hypothetical protein
LSNITNYNLNVEELCCLEAAMLERKTAEKLMGRLLFSVWQKSRLPFSCKYFPELVLQRKKFYFW